MRLKIKEFCLLNDISMRELGRRIGMKISVLSRINTGRVCATIATLDKIATALDTDYNSLIDKESELPSQRSMEIFSSFKEAENSDLGLTPFMRAQLADEKGKELLERQRRLNESGMEIRKCF